MRRRGNIEEFLGNEVRMMQKCKRCNGSGKYQDQLCGLCGGTGEVQSLCADGLEKSIKVPIENILQEIFKHQLELQNSVLSKTTVDNCVIPLPFGISSYVPGVECIDPFTGNVISSNTVQVKEYFTKEYVTAIEDECAELRSWINWKTWKKDRKVVNIEEVKYEIIDILHFWVNLCLIWGITPEDVYRYYMNKKKQNVVRQETGY